MAVYGVADGTVDGDGVGDIPAGTGVGAGEAGVLAGLRSGLGRGTTTIRGFTDTTPRRTSYTRTRTKSCGNSGLAARARRSFAAFGMIRDQMRMLSMSRVVPTYAATAISVPGITSTTVSSVSGFTVSK